VRSVNSAVLVVICPDEGLLTQLLIDLNVGVVLEKFLQQMSHDFYIIITTVYPSVVQP